MYKIGFIDEEKTQIQHFYQTFKNDFDVYQFELTQGAEPESLIREAFDKHLDALIIDFRMNGFFGFNGDLIVEKLNEINPFFPKILLTSFPFEALDFVDDANIVNTKDIWSGDSPDDLKIFIKKLNRLIRIYYEKINDTEQKLKSLEEKRIESSLEPIEEDQYVNLNNFLSKVAGQNKDLPRDFYSQKTSAKLDILIEKTEQMLNKLTEK
jgi:hypothetical protein